MPQMSRIALADSSNTASGRTEEKVTFAVEGMYCALCPVTVRKAMEGVSGVKSVSVDFEAKTAVVVFDPSLATSDQIAKASANAGYPASPAS
ncbi:MAG: heavy metal transporter [Thiobacillus sp.]|nr:heavy metal transporter [Thiobacillus sp.]